MSRYQPNYDSNESRRSPRDQSPGRYNDISDDFRGIPNRERRRSNPDARTNQAAFNANRELFREPIGRESARDFSREPPRGPKGIPDAPTGPRVSSYGEFRNELNFRGDGRSERGRGRGHGWRDDGRERDRGREIERDYQDRREERFSTPFRDDRGRDRWGSRDVYNNVRRLVSPQGRGRSPSYGQRENRESLPNLDIELTRRGSRDGPLSSGFPSSDGVQSFSRGFSRSRGARGRIRTGYYDDYYRMSGPSRSPTDTGWNRRTQPSATPPPPVPAFGSSSNAIPIGTNLNLQNASAVNTHGPVPGVAVPTAPRSERRPVKIAASSVAQTNTDNSRRELIDKQPNAPASSTLRISSPNSKSEQRNDESEPETQEEGELSQASDYINDASKIYQNALVPSVDEVLPQTTSDKTTTLNRKRYPVIGIRQVKVSNLIEDEGNTSDSDSGDDFGDEYFEKEISRVMKEIDQISIENPLLPRVEPKVILLNVFLQSDILDVIETTEFATLQDCKVPEIPTQSQDQISPLNPFALTIKTKCQGRNLTKNSLSGTVGNSSRPPTSTESSRCLTSDIQVGTDKPFPSKLSIKIESPRSRCRSPLRNILSSGHGLKRSASTDLVKSENRFGDSENLLLLESVRKRMRTPPILSLPSPICKLWYEDEEFLKTLEPNATLGARIIRHLVGVNARRKIDQAEERRRWASRYHRYRRFTDRSSDPAAVRSRERFLKSRAKSAAEAAAPPSVLASAGSKPEGSRRVGSRFATEHELQRVLLESEQEAKETKERKERVIRASTTAAKEAIIPDMLWDDEEKDAIHFEDKTGLIPFERSFAILEFGEPIDNFTQEEIASFEKAYFEFPKQWGKIAEYLPARDYKSCIQHYYLVKHPSSLKKKLKDHGRKKKGRQSKTKKDKSIPLINDLCSIRDDDTPDVEADIRIRRPRRAAAPTFNSDLKDQASENEIPSPASASKKIAVAQNSEQNNDTPTTTLPAHPSSPPPPTSSIKRKAKASRDRTTKQSRNNPSISVTPMSQISDSPATPLASDCKKEKSQEDLTRIGMGFDNASPRLGANKLCLPAEETPTTTLTNANNIGKSSLSASISELPVTTTSSTVDLPQTQRIAQQTSSYWSVPEQEIFSALLGHFGTNWHGISNYMATKTHIMVKNHFQRQVDSGKMKEWEVIAKEADEKIERGESTGLLPTPIVISQKRRLDTQGASAKSLSTMENGEDVASTIPNTFSQSALSTPTTAAFPISFQTSPHSRTRSSTTSSVASNSAFSQTTRNSQPQPNQMSKTRGPPLGYFETGPPSRQQQSEKVSQRKPKISHDSQRERQATTVLEIERDEQQKNNEQLPDQQKREQKQRDYKQHEKQQRDKQLRDKQLREQQQREKQQSEKQKLREQQQHEQQQREQKQREKQQREQQQREQQQREQQQREQQRREKQLREKQQLEKQQLEKQQLEKQQLEKQQLEKQQREKQLREKQQLEKQQLEKQQLEKQQLEKQQLEKQLREKQLREKQLREKQLREKQLREKQLREKQLREKQLREKQLREKQQREQQQREQQQHEQQQREQQQREQQQREQQQREQQQREQQQREQQKREQQQREQQQREQQQREQQQREQEQREKQQREQQQREQQQREQQQREQQQREQQKREQQQREQQKREQQQREQQQREQQQREQQQREQQQREQQKREQQQREQQQREQQQREQQQREQQQREQQQREQQQREQQQREQQQREQQQREQQQREQQQREQQQREQQKREKQQREQQQREQQKREQQQREQQQREQQQREQYRREHQQLEQHLFEKQQHEQQLNENQHREHQKKQEQIAREQQVQHSTNMRRDRESENELKLQTIQREAQQVALHREQQNALRRDQLALPLDRQPFSLKQETISPKLESYENYFSQHMHNQNSLSPRTELMKPVSASAEARRSVQANQFQSQQSRLHHPMPLSLLNDNPIPHNMIKLSSAQAVQGPINIQTKSKKSCESQTPIHQSAALSNFRQPEVIRKTSSIMSLLNKDEPNEASKTPLNRLNDTTTSIPLPQPPINYASSSPSKYPSKSSQIITQSSTPGPPQMASQAPSQSHTPNKNLYSHHASHSVSESVPIGKQSRSYTPVPTKFEGHGTYVSPLQAQPHKIYQQSSHAQSQSNNGQGQISLHRDVSINDIHLIANGGFSRTINSCQPPNPRIKEPPYSANSSPQLVHQSQSVPSPLEPTNSEQDYYGHQHQSHHSQPGSHQKLLSQHVQQQHTQQHIPHQLQHQQQYQHPQQTPVRSVTSPPVSDPNITLLQSQHSYHTSARNSQQSHPQGQHQTHQSRSKSIGQRQLSYGHPSHISDNSNGLSSQPQQYSSQIQHNSHPQFPPLTNQATHGTSSSSRRNRRDSLDERFNTQLPPNTSHSTVQQQVGYVLPLQAPISGPYNGQNQTPLRRTTSLGSQLGIQQCDMTDKYNQYERERHLRNEDYQQTRLREPDDRDRGRIGR